MPDHEANPSLSRQPSKDKIPTLLRPSFQNLDIGIPLNLNIATGLPTLKTFRETPIDWRLELLDPAERAAFHAYLDKAGQAGLRNLTAAVCICYFMYFFTLFLDTRSPLRSHRMYLAVILISLSGLACISTFHPRSRAYWKPIKTVTSIIFIFSNLVLFDMIYAFDTTDKNGAGEDIQSHLTLATCLFTVALHPYIPILASTISVIIRIVMSCVMYNSESARAVATMGISLCATMLPVHYSLITRWIYEMWIFHTCRRHGLDLRMLDVRAQYGIRFRIVEVGRGGLGSMVRQGSMLRHSRSPSGVYASGGGAMGGRQNRKVSLHTVTLEKRSWKQAMNVALLRWDDPVVERLHRVRSYESGYIAVLTYLVFYFLKHVTVSLINKRLTSPDAIVICGTLATTFALIIIYQLTRKYHHDIFILYGLICMICTTTISLAFLWQAVPYFPGCCAWNAREIFTVPYIADQRNKFYGAVCPIMGQMFNVATLFRLPYTYQFSFMVFTPFIVLASIGGRSLFWAFNFAACLVISMCVSYATEVWQRKVVRLGMILRELEGEGGGVPQQYSGLCVKEDGKEGKWKDEREDVRIIKGAEMVEEGFMEVKSHNHRISALMSETDSGDSGLGSDTGSGAGLIEAGDRDENGLESRIFSEVREDGADISSIS